jgi:precorrin-2 dehydrogenase/sirohydrochlorin ferrochelatase
MAWYPLFVRMDGRRCLVVGGGDVAHRKAAGLLEAGAAVIAVSLDFSAGFDDLAARYRDRLRLEREPYSARDLSPFALVVAATDDEATNAQVARDAQRVGVWVNVVDTPELCTAQAPAVVRRGPLQVAIHTSGEYPALSSVLREELLERFDPWFETYLAALARVREFLRALPIDADVRRRVLRELADPVMRDECRGMSEDGLFERFVAESRRRLENS